MSGKRTVLVSGGEGYIGSHTAVELINAGYNVVIIDNLSYSESDSVTGVEQITGKKVDFEVVDTCNTEMLKRVFDRYEFDSVIHFAAYKAVGESMAEPLKYYQNNLVSFMNIVSLMKEYGRPNIKVLDTDTRWFGVTYVEDRPGVVEKFAELHREKIYPDRLF